MKGNFETPSPSETFGNARRHFCLSQFGGGGEGLPLASGEYKPAILVLDPIMHRIPPTIKTESIIHVNSNEIGKAYSRGMWFVERDSYV